MWLIQECRRDFIRQGREPSYAELAKLAGACPAYQILIDPDHAPFASPGDMPAKIDAFCARTGQQKPQSDGAYVRACVDSLALKYRQALEGLEKLLGKTIGTIHIVGGGTQNELLNQLTADVCKKAVITGPVEATAIGNILVQAIATGAVKDLAEARQIVRDSFPVKRYEASGGDVDAIYQRFLALQK
jgi:rhamnulokinase